MFSTTLKLQVPSPAIKSNRHRDLAGKFSSWRSLTLRLPERRLASLSLQTGDDSPSQPSLPSQQHYTSSVGSPPSPLQWNLTHRHIVVLNVIACTTAVSATWLFCAAIPTLLALKRAAESLEKLLDVTREELPDTMAAVRLSGMEISDLTMELSDLGQEITQGVKSSTRAVRIAEERLRRIANMAPSVQEAPVVVKKTAEPKLAKAARGARQTIVKGREVAQMIFSFTKISRIVLAYFASRAKP